jgi:hypothetical protein
MGLLLGCASLVAAFWCFVVLVAMLLHFGPAAWVALVLVLAGPSRWLWRWLNTPGAPPDPSVILPPGFVMFDAPDRDFEP